MIANKDDLASISCLPCVILESGFGILRVKNDRTLLMSVRNALAKAVNGAEDAADGKRVSLRILKDPSFWSIIKDIIAS